MRPRLALEKSEHSTGIHYYKSKPHTSDRVFMQGTRKKGCEAHIQIVEFIIYPKFSMKLMMSTELSQKRIRIIREDHLKALREIFFDEGLQVEHRFFVKLPTEEAHHKCHPTKGVMGLSQRVHPVLIAKIQEFVSIGTVDPADATYKTTCYDLPLFFICVRTNSGY